MSWPPLDGTMEHTFGDDYFSRGRSTPDEQVNAILNHAYTITESAMAGGGFQSCQAST